MYWQGTLEKSNGEVVGRRAGSPPLAPAARRVVSFYEKALPGFFGSARDPASAAIHLGFWDGKTHTRRGPLRQDCLVRGCVRIVSGVSSVAMWR